MTRTSVRFCNLRAEMARRNVTISQMAKSVGFNRDTLGRKLSGKSPLSLAEAFEIQKMFFPDVGVDVLFEELCTTHIPPDKKGA